MSLGNQIAQAGGRRFVMALGAGIVNTLLLMGGYIGEASYVPLTLGIVGVYVAGGTAQKFVKE